MLKKIKVSILIAFFIFLCSCDNSQTNKSNKKHPDAIGKMLENSSHDIKNNKLSGDPINDPFSGK